MDDGFTTHQIEDLNGEKRNALVHYRKDERHVSISVTSFESGTQMTGEAVALVNKLFKRCKRADLFLGHRRPIRLPVGYTAVQL